ncbi:P-loop containing nucleoside triphosphate hydrolase protein [Aspergillus sergii]|uniref:P-loop containing nucleoside triphosphate hydrolase protein n=1 Tax=Aspergillus sergii TaxID=1034303 RepID=A0A5N6WIR1_9EURO|nr:P-loop containing nucleoside triphosphate hydrolase protein [Aspergillus sergii]
MFRALGFTADTATSRGAFAGGTLMFIFRQASSFSSVPSREIVLNNRSQVIAYALAFLKFTALAFAISKRSFTDQTLLSIACVFTIKFAAACFLVALVPLEHSRTVRPSFLFSFYLSTDLIFNVAPIGSPWPADSSLEMKRFLAASIGVELILLALETVEKRRWLLTYHAAVPRESTSGPFSRLLFLWLNHLLKAGYTNTLTPDCILPPVHEGLESTMLFEDFAIAWENSDHDRRLALFLVLIKCIRWEIAKIAVPRQCLVIFNMAQPFLLSRTMVYFGSIGSRLPRDTAGDLIRDSAIIFIGIAISNATYEHLGYRAMAMLRSGTTALVYHTMMWLHIDIAHESGAISLVDSDIDSVAEFVRHAVCDTWANALQLGLATWLLSAQIGAICIVPIIVAIGFASISLYIGGSVSRHQKSWLEATQKRVDFTTRVLGSIKSIKMLGLIEGMVYMIEVLRTEELKISKKFQRIQAARVSLVLELDNVTIGTGPDHPKHIGRLTLRLPTPSLNMIVGPVGCGKSILLKTILGEIEPVEGNISISGPEVAYCRSRCYDGEWYRSIIRACCLDNDLREMPVGDNTLIGRQGTKLSQGKKQRIAIARAVYARKPFAFFDDVLNGLDQVTARKVFDRVFSARGILRRIGSSSTSSLILAILGMAEVKSGRILIDGEDISMLSPSIVRNRVQYIAQEPFLVPGSIRQNLDPLGDKCDSEIIIALERVQLWGTMVDRSLMYGFPDCNTLDIMIDDGFLSYGQQQLLCLARKLLKQSTILLLDAPTSDLDAEEDLEIQAVIRSEFSCCTTIMIAPNLRTILDFGYVAVIDEGRIVELGNPQSLLLESQGIFGALYHAEKFDQGSDL